MLRKRHFIYWLILISFSYSHAQNLSSSIGGQIRYRGEADRKNFAADADRLWNHLLRSRINFAIKPEKNIAVFIQVQDSRLFGGENPTLSRGTQDGSAKTMDLQTTVNF